MYEISGLFARDNKLPKFFVANEILQTQKAVYLYGHGTLESQKKNRCCICGRELTHPVSVILGIGPECGGHWWDWKAVGGYSEELLETLKIEIKKFKVDQWFPKGIIKEVYDCEEKIVTPPDHKMLQKKTNQVKKEATLVKYQSSGAYAIKITFPFDKNLIDKIKSLSGRRFHAEGETKYWSCPRTIENITKLVDWGFPICENLQNFLEKSMQQIDNIKEVEIPKLGLQLFPYQNKGVAFIEHRDGRALIADEMGLGKTAQALAWLQLRKDVRPVIIVVPASLKLNWAKEARMWMDKPNIQILDGKNSNIPIIGDIIIINYDILHAWYDTLLSIKPQALILDECHYVKNNGAKRTKAAKKLGKRIPHVLALSGTPIVNRPIELYNAINLIDGGLFPNFWKYAERYCGARHNGFGWDFSGATNTEELHKILIDHVMIRRLKKDVLTELPEKTRSFVPMELDNRKEYNKAESDFIQFIREQKGAAAAAKASTAATLVEIEGLKQLAVKGKMNQAIDWIKNFVEIDGKLVVFAVHRSTIDRLMQEFSTIAVKIDGSTPQNERQNAVDRFQTDDNIRLFIGNIKAAGVGITLTAASNVVILELPWTPGELEQAIDRTHRIGQKYPVTAHFLLAEGTIEEKIARIIDQKSKILNSVLDGIETEKDSLLTVLINEYSN